MRLSNYVIKTPRQSLFKQLSFHYYKQNLQPHQPIYMAVQTFTSFRLTNGTYYWNYQSLQELDFYRVPNFQFVRTVLLSISLGVRLLRNPILDCKSFPLPINLSRSQTFTVSTSKSEDVLDSYQSLQELDFYFWKMAGSSRTCELSISLGVRLLLLDPESPEDVK